MAHELVQPPVEGTIKQIPAIDIATLFGGNVPRQKTYNPVTTEIFYDKFARRPFYPFVVEGHGQKAEIVVVGTLVTGRQLTHLFHFAAPSKFFGVDPDDIRMDWNDLFTKPYHAKRLEAHRRIPGWQQYEQRREDLLRLIENDYAGRTTGLNGVIPVLRLQTTEQAVPSWNFADAEPQLLEAIFQINPGLQGRQEMLYSILGPLVAAAYSPAVTQSWGERRTYAGTAKGNEIGSQNMGSTQILPITIGLAGDLTGTPFVKNLVNHVESQRASLLRRPTQRRFRIF